MRCFVVICLLATSAYADVSHVVSGYTYERGSSGGSGGQGFDVSSGGLGGLGGSISYGGQSGGSGGFVGGHGAGVGSVGGGSGSGGLSGFGGSSGLVSSGGYGGSILSAGGLGSGLGGGLSGGVGGGFVSGGSGGRQIIQEPAEVEFVKEFYTFDAPQEEYHEDESVQRTKESFKKNLQVLFIKTPEVRGIERAALSLAKSASEQNTAIYILQKQPDVSEFSHQLNLIHTHNAHKPEVHFVKYKTPEDAANAQRTIQAQFDNLGGTTLHRHGGVPQILNFASQYAPAYGQHQVASSGPSSGFGGVSSLGGPSVGVSSVGGPSVGGSSVVGGFPSQTYLPSKAKK